MSPFDVEVRGVPDLDLGPLLIKLAEAGFPDPSITPSIDGAPRQRAFRSAGPRPMPSSSNSGGGHDLPRDWRIVQERDGQSYAWPEYIEDYTRYRVFLSTTEREGAVHIALGECIRPNAWGRARKYVISFLTSGSPQKPITEFLATDDYDETHELIAVIRGSDGGRRMYSPGTALPPVYEEHFRTVLYSDRIAYKGAWNKLAVVAHEDNDQTILNHALVQARRRYA
jgi:hypothetical protein